MEALHTIPELIQFMEKNYSNPKAFSYLDNDHWKHLSTEEFIFNVKRLTYGLASMGLKRGDTVGILADSSPLWCIADFAIIMAGGITIPLYSRISDENFVYECALANVRFLFIEGEDQWLMFDEHRNLFEKVISFDEPSDMTGLTKHHDLLTRGEKLWQEKPTLFEELALQINPEDICTIIYTAGSTGMPKGVQLTHKNLCHHLNQSVFGWENGPDIYLSILPLAHVFARQINLILMAWDVNIYYLNELSKLAEVSRKIKPTMMIAVPRLVEKMYEAFEANIKLSKGLEKKIGTWALNLANDRNETWFKKIVLRPIADALVYYKFRQAIGGRWRVILCGGAALDVRLSIFFMNIGVPVFEGWGLTEGSTVSCNFPGSLKHGSVGKPLPGVTVTLGENDELLVAGPTVMKGYYRFPEATAEAIDEEGRLHTGDKGSIDQDGFITITGRIKEQFKLSSGEYLVPSKIEQMLTQHPLIALAIAIGEGRKYAACLLFPDKEMIGVLKEEQQMEHLSDEDFLHSPDVESLMEDLLIRVNSRINDWEKLVRYRFIMDTPTLESGELTPTLRLKRRVVLEKYKDLVDSIYSEEA